MIAFRNLIVFGAAAFAAAVLSVAPSVAPVSSADAGTVPSAPCYNGVTPWNPYVANCALPSRPPRVNGSAPDQTAILACSVGSQVARGLCLSQFVNGGPY